MVIDFRKNGRKWQAEVWDDPVQKLSGVDLTRTLLEDQYIEINKWCIDTFGYYARTAYNIFEFRKEKDLTMFVLKWSD